MDRSWANFNAGDSRSRSWPAISNRQGVLVPSLAPFLFGFGRKLTFMIFEPNGMDRFRSLFSSFS